MNSAMLMLFHSCCMMILTVHCFRRLLTAFADTARILEPLLSIKEPQMHKGLRSYLNELTPSPRHIGHLMRVSHYFIFSIHLRLDP